MMKRSKEPRLKWQSNMKKKIKKIKHFSHTRENRFSFYIIDSPKSTFYWKSENQFCIIWKNGKSILPHLKKNVKSILHHLQKYENRFWKILEKWRQTSALSFLKRVSFVVPQTTNLSFVLGTRAQQTKLSQT